MSINFFKLFMDKQQKKAIADAKLKTEKRVRDECEYDKQRLKDAFKYREKLMRKAHKTEKDELRYEIYELENKLRKVDDKTNNKLRKILIENELYLNIVKDNIHVQKMMEINKVQSMEAVVHNASESNEKLKKEAFNVGKYVEKNV